MDLNSILVAILIGLFAGLCSGSFGLGGGIITTPLMRLFLGIPGLLALGTSLPATIPTAVSGALVYSRKKFIIYKASLLCVVTGSLFCFLGARITAYFTGMQMMFIITALLFLVGAKFLFSMKRNIPEGRQTSIQIVFSSIAILLIIGAVAGFTSGFLGIGGGIILVPLLVMTFKISIKQAIGTSLMFISLQAIPGSVEHYLLVHVDPILMLLIILGSVLGAQLGARFTTRAKERKVRIAFAIFLFLLTLALGLSELFRL